MILTTRLMRTLGLMAIAMLLVMASVASPLAAQDSTPAAGQPVGILGTEITWTGEWEYDDQNAYSVASLPEQAFFFQRDDDTDHEIGYVKLLSYGLLEDDMATSPSEAVEVFAELFLGGASPNALDRSEAGELEDGTAWRMYTFTPSEADDLQSQSVSSLITASQDDDGALVVTSLTTPSDLLEATIIQVQNDFTLDGVDQLFAGIDAAEVTAELPTEESPNVTRDATPVGTPDVTVVEEDGTPDATPDASPVISPDATPLDEAEATLAAEQDPSETLEATPSD